MSEKCNGCNAKLNGVEHANGNLGKFSFEGMCDTCQSVYHDAYRASVAGDRTTHLAAVIAAGANVPRPTASTAPSGGA